MAQVNLIIIDEESNYISNTLYLTDRMSQVKEDQVQEAHEEPV